MRESKSFRERTIVVNNRQVRRKFFLVFEGAETEKIYFNAINRNRLNLKIDPIIEFITLVRDFGENGWSNPLKIVKRLIDNVKESQDGIMTYDVLINRFHDYMTSTNLIQGDTDRRAYWDILKRICEEDLSKKLDESIDNIDETIEQIKKYLVQKSSIVGISDSIVDIIKSLSITFDIEFDRICLIVDRDKGSFVVNENINQYKEVLDKCRDNGFDLYVTNPCFEFWLLLHFDDCVDLDIEQLYENRKVSRNMRYVESELKKRMTYNKTNYNADCLMTRLPNAIENEKKFCEDLTLLEENVGSNLGKLFTGLSTDI